MSGIAVFSPLELLQAIGRRAKARRIGMRLRQADLATQAGVPLSTLRRFEAGSGSLETAARVAFALRAEREFLDLFPAHDARSLDDVLAATRVRKRVRR
jgi:transcriptional regulator with XRE-family HTH domain